MAVNEKEILYRTINSYLVDEYPTSLDEFEVTFDVIYETLISQQKFMKGKANFGNIDGVSLDSGIMGQAVISMACVVGFSLLKAVLKDSTQRDLPKFLDKMETILSEKTGRPDVVKAIRKRMQGILQAL